MDDSIVVPETFLFAAQCITNRPAGMHLVPQERRFRTILGVSPRGCAVLWEEMGGDRPEDNEPVHLLWTLLFLMSYSTENILSVIAGVNRKTYRKWVWLQLAVINDLLLVCRFIQPRN